MATGTSPLCSRRQWQQESWAIAKMTARCALCMGAMKIFWSPWLRPWLLFSKFLMGFCSDWAYKCACCVQNLKFVALPVVEIIGGTPKIWAVPPYAQTDRRTDDMRWQDRAMHYSASRGNNWEVVFTARCTIVQSAVLRSHVVRPSVCLSVTLVDQDHIGWQSWKLISRTISPTPSLFVAQTPSTYSQGNMGKFGGE